jgi:hypothetical protein
MNLSWFDTEPSSDPDDLIENYTSLNINYMIDPLTDYKDIWVSNNGSETGKDNLIDFGFYVNSDNIQAFNDLLKLASETNPSGDLCGLFIIFGYYQDDGDYISYMDTFDTLSVQEQAKFQVNWTQGTSALNKISLKNALTYNGIGSFPVARNNFELNDGNLSIAGEGAGVVKIRVLVKGVPGGNTLLSTVELNAYCLGEI